MDGFPRPRNVRKHRFKLLHDSKHPFLSVPDCSKTKGTEIEKYKIDQMTERNFTELGQNTCAPPTVFVSKIDGRMRLSVSHRRFVALKNAISLPHHANGRIFWFTWRRQNTIHNGYWKWELADRNWLKGQCKKSFYFTSLTLMLRLYAICDAKRIWKISTYIQGRFVVGKTVVFLRIPEPRRHHLQVI